MESYITSITLGYFPRLLKANKQELKRAVHGVILSPLPLKKWPVTFTCGISAVTFRSCGLDRTFEPRSVIIQSRQKGGENHCLPCNEAK